MGPQGPNGPEVFFECTHTCPQPPSLAVTRCPILSSYSTGQVNADLLSFQMFRRRRSMNTPWGTIASVTEEARAFVQGMVGSVGMWEYAFVLNE